jgi:transcriptional regulator with AAA-type ATPase domain
MTDKAILDKENREFFIIVAKAAFSNPFGAESLELDCKIAEGEYDPGEILNRKILSNVRQRLHNISIKGKLDWKTFVGEEREIIRIALLYDAFHRFMEDFDKLIAKQIEAGHGPCNVPFAKDLLKLLRERGFSPEEARHNFAFFYQLRRAWYFIYYGLIGQNPSIKKLRSHFWRSIFTYDPRWYEKFLWNRMEDFSTFLVGETGTGKGTAAAAIGRSGFIPFDEKKGCFAESFTSNFIEINLSQFPEALIESELFGHKKGSFTGAIEDYQGVFARSSQYGAIFLDEIGDISIPVQIKLLKVIQERIFSAVGSHKKLYFHGRVIAATNRPLDELRRKRAFRDDFYYRLCSDIIHVPSLRQQIAEDHNSIKTLLDHVVKKIIGEPAPELQKSIHEILDKEIGPNYHWPGNVRELEQATRRILLTRHYRGEVSNVSASLTDRLKRAIDEESVNAQELLSSYCAILYQRHGTYEEVSRITKLDRRTVKKHIIATKLN